MQLYAFCPPFSTGVISLSRITLAALNADLI